MSEKEVEVKPKLTKAEKKALYRTDYPEPIKSRREQLKEEFAKEDGNDLKSIIMSYFDEDIQTQENIYSTVIDHFMAMPDKFKTQENCITSQYLKCFLEWTRARGEDALRSEFLTLEIKKRALKCCSGKITYYMPIFSEIFCFHNLNFVDVIVEDVKERLKKNEFSEAAGIVSNHKLHKHFRFTDIALPLILQNRCDTAFLLMKDSKSMQIDCSRFFDKLIGQKPEKVHELLNPWENITFDENRFIGKRLKKFMNTLYNKICPQYDYVIDPKDHAPNYHQKNMDESLQNFVSWRYEKNSKNISITDDVYVQNILYILQNCKDEVVNNFLFFLWSSNSIEKKIDAVRWMLKLKIDYGSPKLPTKMCRNAEYHDEALQLLQKDEQFNDFDENNHFYLFNKTRVYYIKNNEDLIFLNKDLSDLDKNADDYVYIGVDTEWKPSYISDNLSKISLIQLYTGKNVYLIDYVSLEQKNDIMPCTWKELTDNLFYAKNLRLIGFAIANDLDSMFSINEIKNFIKPDEIKNTFCLKKFCETVKEHDVDLGKKCLNLSDLTMNLLNISLSKEQQLSNWAVRPLRSVQVEYAAMDAYVVVKCFEKIIEKIGSDNDVDALVNESNALVHKEKDPELKRIRNLDNYTWLQIYEKVCKHRNRRKKLSRPYEIKCIVDNMLIGFGKSLRRCGIDVIIPESTTDFTEKCRIIASGKGESDREILSVPSKNLYKLHSFTTDIMLFDDLNDKLPIDQLCVFFKKFNIDIRPTDVYLRCVECNSMNLMVVPGPIVKVMSECWNRDPDDQDMSVYNEWVQRMNKIDSKEYGDINVEIMRPTEESTWIVAKTDSAFLHITKFVIVHHNCPLGVHVKIKKVPTNVFERNNLLFWICGECGLIHYDGKNIEITEDVKSAHEENLNE